VLLFDVAMVAAFGACLVAMRRRPAGAPASVP
jgi:hypothetical protein